MYEEIQVLAHSSIRIEKNTTVYFDPFHVSKDYHDADIIFITHEHFDHYSPEDIARVKNESSILICPKSMEASIANSTIPDEFIELVEPWDELQINDVKIEVVPAYNVGKSFHPAENKWVGYIVTMGDTRYYIAGDTDYNSEIDDISCDVALLPVGGTYTMNVEEAARLAIKLNPSMAIPTHYGDVAGDKEDGSRFAKAIKGQVPCMIKL